MAWYFIVGIVIVALFALLFIVYITNADLKLVQVLYDYLIKKQDNRSVDSKL